MDNTASKDNKCVFNIKKAYCFTVTNKKYGKIRKIISSQEKKVNNVNVVESFVASEKKEIVSNIKEPQKKSQVNVMNSYVMALPKKDLIKLQNIDNLNRVNVMDSYVMATGKDIITKLGFDEIEDSDSISFIINLFFINRRVNFKENVCQKVFEKDSSFLTVSSRIGNLIGEELNQFSFINKENSISKETLSLELKRIKETAITRFNKLDSKQRMAELSGFVLNRTLIIASSLLVFVTSIVIVIKLVR